MATGMVCFAFGFGYRANFELQVETERVRRVEARRTAGRRGTTASTVEELDFRGRLESRAQANAFSMLIRVDIADSTHCGCLVGRNGCFLPGEAKHSAPTASHGKTSVCSKV